MKQYIHYIYGRLLEKLGSIISKRIHYNNKQYNIYLKLDSIVIYRFKHINAQILNKYNILTGNLGIGKHLVNNIHSILNSKKTIYIYTKDINDKLSFTYRNEIRYILSNKKLMQKTKVIIELKYIDYTLDLDTYIKEYNEI